MSKKPRTALVAPGPGGNVIMAPVPPVRMRIFVVRDPGIAFGGQLVADLTEFKRKIMDTRTSTPWTLVLAIHGSLDLIKAQVPGKPNNDVPYTAADIDMLFGDEDNAWAKWRAAYGPSGSHRMPGQFGI